MLVIRGAYIRGGLIFGRALYSGGAFIRDSTVFYVKNDFRKTFDTFDSFKSSFLSLLILSHLGRYNDKYAND